MVAYTQVTYDLGPAYFGCFQDENIYYESEFFFANCFTISILYYCPLKKIATAPYTRASEPRFYPTCTCVCIYIYMYSVLFVFFC